MSRDHEDGGLALVGSHMVTEDNVGAAYEYGIGNLDIMSDGVDVFLFFFQAEDGIRDYKVTGVQTCALPISCKEISADWAAQRIKGLSLVSAALRALLPRQKPRDGKVIKTLIESFRYPRKGPEIGRASCRERV